MKIGRRTISILAFTAAFLGGSVMTPVFAPSELRSSVRVLRFNNKVENCVPIDSELRYRKLGLKNSTIPALQRPQNRAPRSADAPDPLARDGRDPGWDGSMGGRVYILVHRERCGTEFRY